MSEDHDIFLAANLGSEVARLFRARKERNMERVRGAYERASEIVKELNANTSSNGQKESSILQAVLDDFMQESPTLSIHPETLNAYFLPFAHKVLGI